MRSGNGRHRRPRQAPALFVTAGVTGAGIAIPLLGATGAQAADAGTWDRVADCESGGAWSANDSNGYYGGLQLDLDTWKYYGGTIYAERPDLASRSQQIAVGEKILEAEGPRAFPQCGDDLELPGVDPDAEQDAKPEATPTPPGTPSRTPSPSPSEESDEADGPGGSGKSRQDGESDEPGKGEKTEKPGKGSPEAKPSPDAEPSDDASQAPSDQPSDTPGDGASKSPQPPSGDGGSDDDTSDSGSSGWSDLGPSSPDRLKSPSERAEKPEEAEKPTGSGKGKHRGRPADDERDEDRASRDEDRDRAGGGGKHRITVQPGDPGEGVAAEHDVEGGWVALYERNREVIGDDPDLLRPGRHLTL
ncbi:transglycosylase family protein [Streptomyces sp. B15]|uniref:transglycosylase family protein n=1 Tax=Streptomyces sp. B15 TaxID=1537797 RepID=UPI001B36BBE0|nr:transglycosylase family protein [Streptomyces sp. B15]MBQ1118941.1 transglycosylase family protein [Streptomyces sp. B15]